MYFAKRQGPGRFALYKETMNASALMRLTLGERKLRSATQSKRVLTALSAAGAAGGPASYRASRRYCAGNNVDLGSVPPVDFIPVAEEPVLFCPLVNGCYARPCTQAKGLA